MRRAALDSPSVPGCDCKGPHVHVRRRDNTNRAWSKSEKEWVQSLDFLVVQAFDQYFDERHELLGAGVLAQEQEATRRVEVGKQASRVGPPELLGPLMVFRRSSVNFVPHFAHRGRRAPARLFGGFPRSGPVQRRCPGRTGWPRDRVRRCRQRYPEG